MAKAPKPATPAAAQHVEETSVLRHEAVDMSKPLRQAFTLERVPGGWTMATLFYNDAGELVRIERCEPDVKAQIIERFKIAAFKYWSTIG